MDASMKEVSEAELLGANGLQVEAGVLAVTDTGGLMRLTGPGRKAYGPACHRLGIPANAPLNRDQYERLCRMDVLLSLEDCGDESRIT